MTLLVREERIKQCVVLKVQDTFKKLWKSEAFLAAFAKQKMLSSIAQSVEHAAVNRAVVGSSPTRGVRKLT